MFLRLFDFIKERDLNIKRTEDNISFATRHSGTSYCILTKVCPGSQKTSNASIRFEVDGITGNYFANPQRIEEDFKWQTQRRKS